jgi:hypothetical protein
LPSPPSPPPHTHTYSPLIPPPFPPAQLSHDFTAANTPAALASATIALPAVNVSLPFGQQGAILAAVSSTNYTVMNMSMFDINNPDTATAQAQINAMLAFLSTSAVQDPNNYVVGVAATSKRYRRLLYEYNNHPYTSREVDMHDMYGYYYMNTDSLYKSRYNKTWSGAFQYCVDRGKYLCDQHDYAYTSLYRVAPNVTNLPTTFGTVPVSMVAPRWSLPREHVLPCLGAGRGSHSTIVCVCAQGFGWAPFFPRDRVDTFDNLRNNWVAMGNAFAIRVGRNWTEVQCRALLPFLIVPAAPVRPPTPHPPLPLMPCSRRPRGRFPTSRTCCPL